MPTANDNRPVSVGNLKAYHETFWGGGGSVLERRWRGAREGGV